MTDSYAYDDEEKVYDGHPAVATALCACLLVGSCASSMGARGLGRMAQDPAQVMGYILGGGIFGALLWGLAYAITIKRASPRWRIASLIVLIAMGVLTSFVHIARADMGERQRVVGVMDKVMASNGQMPVELGADAGPLERMMALSLNGRMADRKAYQAEADADGLTTVVMFTGLTKSSPVLARCDRFTALQDHAVAISKRMPQVVVDMQKMGRQAIARGEMSQRDLDGFLKGMAGSNDDYQRSWLLTAQIAGNGGKACQILARKRWQKSVEGKILFTNAADLAAIQPLLENIDKASAEIDRMQNAARKNATSTIDKLR